MHTKRNPVRREFDRPSRGWCGAPSPRARECSLCGTSATFRTRRSSGSSAPTATITLDFALVRLTGLIDKLLIYPSGCRQNLDRMGGLVHSQGLLLALT